MNVAELINFRRINSTGHESNDQMKWLTTLSLGNDTFQ